MAQNINQFAQTPVQGMMDLMLNPAVVSAQIDTTSAGGLVPGQAVKMVDSAGGIPKVVECAADTDDVYGFIVYDIKSSVYAVGDKVEVASMRDNCMYMTSSAAIARNASVEIVISGQKVATAATGKRIIGRAFDKATGANQLIRVVIDLPGTLAP